MVAPLLEAGADKRVIDLYKPGKTYIYGEPPYLQLSPEPLVHDVENCCYHMVFGSKDVGEKVFYATDTGTLDSIEAKGYSLYMVEANHTTAGIEARAEEKRERGGTAQKQPLSGSGQNEKAVLHASEFRCVCRPHAGRGSVYRRAGTDFPVL